MELTRSVEELTGQAWGDPPADATTLIRRCYELRRQPVGRLSVEELRMLLSQRIAPEALVPIALGLLNDDPLAEGDFYPGDLLFAVLRQETSFWTAHPALRDQLQAVIARLDACPDELQPAVRKFIEHG